jgi:hypothetical protein
MMGGDTDQMDAILLESRQCAACGKVFVGRTVVYKGQMRNHVVAGLINRNEMMAAFEGSKDDTGGIATRVGNDGRALDLQEMLGLELEEGFPEKLKNILVYLGNICCLTTGTD